MFSNIDLKELPRVALVAMALTWPLASCVGTPGIIDDAPSFHVVVAGVESEAKLITQLRSAGYDEVRVTGSYPSQLDPRPELMHGLTAADDDEAQVTPVHFGWNGTALKDGRRVDIYVDRAPKS